MIEFAQPPLDPDVRRTVIGVAILLFLAICLGLMALRP